MDQAVTGLTYDSRKVRPGFLFVAIQGFKTDGHLYLLDAAANGAASFVLGQDVHVPEGISWVRVSDTRRALAHMAALYYGFPDKKLRMVGVTGTNGKTTTTHLIRSIYEAAGKKTGLLGTIHNIIGDSTLPVGHTTPESPDLHALLHRMCEQEVEVAVMEVSSHALALARVAEVEYDVGVFTNLTQDHLDFHGNMHEYLSAKIKLFKDLGASGTKKYLKFAVINADDEYSQHFIEACSVPVITYGIKNKGADILADGISMHSRGVSFIARGPFGEMQLNLKMAGLFNVYNALAAVAVGAGEKMPAQVIKRGLEEVGGVSGRFELVDRGQDFMVVVDYAHTPDGLENLLRAARELTSGRLWVVFGCGGDRDRKKRPIMGEIGVRLADTAILTSDNPRSEDPLAIIEEVKAGAAKVEGGHYLVEPDRFKAIEIALRGAIKGDLVVIAGKGHEDYQLVGDLRLPFDDRKQAGLILEQIVALKKEDGPEKL